MANSALAQDTTWGKFGYTFAPGILYPVSPLFSSPAALCNHLDVFNFGPQRVCPPRELMLEYCVAARFSCVDPQGRDNLYSNSDSLFTANPACSRWPVKLVSTRGAAGRTGWDSQAGRCSCFRNDRPAANLYPDFDTGLCYESPDVRVNAYPGPYQPRAANTPQLIEAQVLVGERPVADVEVRFEIRSADGQAGTLSTALGRTNADGIVQSTYNFPQFTTKRRDQLVITFGLVSGPKEVVIDIKMSPTLLGFFNGVANTEEQANDGLDALRVHTDALRDKASVKYDLFYNQTGSANGSNVLQDLAEVFDQRSNELDGVLANRWESFWDIAAGRHSSPRSLTGQLLSQLIESRRALAELIDATFNATLGQVAAGWSRLLASPPTASDVASQLTKLRGYAEDDFTLLLVAHSQGNLFVNAAVDGVRSAKPGVQAQVAHIAPASPTLRGPYLLADIDLVINGLRLQGINSVPPVNIALAYSAADASGHTLVATYLDRARPALERVKSMIQTALLSF